jgi:hypothetical protein
MSLDGVGRQESTFGTKRRIKFRLAIVAFSDDAPRQDRTERASTGQGAWRMTRSVVLPRNASRTP